MSYLGNRNIFWQNTWLDTKVLQSGFYPMK